MEVYRKKGRGERVDSFLLVFLRIISFSVCVLQLFDNNSAIYINKRPARSPTLRRKGVSTTTANRSPPIGESRTVKPSPTQPRLSLLPSDLSRTLDLPRKIPYLSIVLNAITLILPKQHRVSPKYSYLLRHFSEGNFVFLS